MIAKKFNPWEVWYAQFPYEDVTGRYSRRPVIVLSTSGRKVLVTKLTCHSCRNADRFDTPIQFWEAAHLNYPSVARVSKTVEVNRDDLLMRIGVLDSYDAFAVFNAYRRLLMIR